MPTLSLSDVFNSTCLSGTPGIPLATTGDCLPGFYCPHNNASHPPEYCAPTPACQVSRIAGKVCPAQGTYEPTVCTHGYYCPPPGREQIICPKGHFCPLGSSKPIECGFGSICGEGALKRVDIMGLGFMVGIDVLLLAGTLGVGAWKWLKERGSRGKKGGAPMARIGTATISGKGHASKGSEDMELTKMKSKEGDEIEEVNEREHENLSADLLKLVESFKRSIDGKHFGLTFDFQNLGLKLKSGRELLSGVNGTIEAGTMWGVMGPSGAGKTTFMNVLMGKVDKSEGTFWVNGVKQEMKEYKRIIGYVPQDDIVLPELTVRENILHSARCRLPSSWSDAEIQAHVDLVISCLSLTHVQHSLVGDAVRPVLSGGQRKRVNIGVELAAAPMCLFCDEPTSGLDSTSALAVLKLLQALSRLGVTVVSVIHQPSIEIYECLDNLLLISAGHAMFQGPREEMVHFLKSEGFAFKPSSNPADIVMDIISGQGAKHRSFARENEVAHLISRWDVVQPTFNPRPAGDSTALKRTVNNRGGSWYKQMVFCFMRSMIQQQRQISSFFLEITVGAIAGALIGLAVTGADGHLFQGIYRYPYEVLSISINYGLLPQIGLIGGLAIGLAGSPSGVKVFGDEKLIYWREAASGHSRSAYYVGKVLCTLPRIALSSLHFATLFALLATPLISFGKGYLLILLNFYCVYGLASIVSMMTRKENGPLLSVVVGIIVSVFCGYGPTLKNAKDWGLEWWWRMCPGTWFTEALYEENLRPYEELFNIEEAAKSLGFNLGWYGKDILGLVALGIAYRIIAYIGLVGLKRDRQR